MHARTLQRKSLDLTTARNALFRLMLTLAATCHTLAGSEARASTLTLDFEGLPHLSWINEYYNGGQSSTGETGPDLGVSFVNETMRIFARDQSLDAFSNNPSGTNIFSYDPKFANPPSVLVPGGFTGVSFYYSSFGEFSVSAFGANGLLGEWTFSAQHDDGCSDSLYCNWSYAEILFSGTGTTLTFNNSGGGFDDLTFVLPDEETPPGTPVPEPSPLALMSASLGLAAWVRSRRAPCPWLMRKSLAPRGVPFF